LDGVRVDADKTLQVVKMLCEGLGVRSASRLSGLNQRTILNILTTAGEHCAQLLNEKIRGLKPEPVEIDECWTFIANKRNQGNTLSSGDFYAFLASGKNTKLIISYVTGKRDDTVGDEFIFDLKQRLPQRFQITSDAWGGFVRGILENAGDNADYAVQIKQYEGYNASMKDSKRRYSPGKCVSVRTKHICGSPKAEDICTSHAERLNLSLRHFNKRFTRLSPCFSKKLKNLELSVALTVAFFNFCRTHKSLKIKATDDAKAVERSPAMAASLTDHIWTVEELLAIPCQK
jgi:IS1 family transposase